MGQKLPEASFAEIAAALRTVTSYEVSTLDAQAALAIKIGLAHDTCQRLAADAQRQADLLAAAWQFFRAASEREAQIRGLFAECPRPGNDNTKPVWRRAISFVLGGARGR